MRTVTPIVSYMTSDDPEVHRTTAMALEKLSMDPQNCITMHQVNIRLYFKVNQLVLDNNTKDKSRTVLNVRCVENVEDLVVVVLRLDIFEVKHVIFKFSEWCCTFPLGMRWIHQQRTTVGFCWLPSQHSRTCFTSRRILT